MNEHDIARALGSGWPEILAGLMLGGPLVAWILYRLAFPSRGKPARRAATQMVAVADDALWLCGSCLSLNLPGAGRCYRCLAARATSTSAAASAMHALDEAEPSPPSWVPVMAPIAPFAAGVTQAPHLAPLPQPALSSVSGADRWSADREARPRVGVMAAPRHVPVATALAGDPGAAGPTSDAKPLCPLLRGIGDARIVFMLPQPMPHPDYRCQAGQRPVAIDATRQTSYCLSAAYRSCDRYLALAHRVSGVGLPDVPEPSAAAVRSRLSG